VFPGCRTQSRKAFPLGMQGTRWLPQFILKIYQRKFIKIPVCEGRWLRGLHVRENLLHFSNDSRNRMCFTFIITKWIMTGASLPPTKKKHPHMYIVRTYVWQLPEISQKRSARQEKIKHVRCKKRDVDDYFTLLMDGWMDGWMDGRLSGRLFEWMITHQ